MQREIIPKELTELILSVFYEVHTDLGYGFLERVYQNALYFAFLDNGLKCRAEIPINVYHNGRMVGEYRADLLIENSVLLELKACETINPAHEAQLINYLKATNIEIGFVLNFGKKAEFSRKIYTNDRKKHLITNI
jgi:GxxExxY protein